MRRNDSRSSLFIIVRSAAVLAVLIAPATFILSAPPAHASSVPLYSFNGSDGAQPYAGLVQGSDGNFYGTTQNGGPRGAGTVFKITPSGTLTTLYSFTGSDGDVPVTGLVQGNDGDLYGTTVSGGASNYGTVFKITPTVAPTNKDQCKSGGWKTFISPRTFKNQGDCIYYVNTGQ